MVVRVIQIRPRLRDRELVVIPLTYPNGRLCDLGRAIHDVRQDKPMPVHSCALRQAIRDVDSNVIALMQVQPRPGNLSVEGVCIHRDTGQDRPADYGGLQIEHLDTVLDTRNELAISARIESVACDDVARIHRSCVRFASRFRPSLTS